MGKEQRKASCCVYTVLMQDFKDQRGHLTSENWLLLIATASRCHHPTRHAPPASSQEHRCCLPLSSEAQDPCLTHGDKQTACWPPKSVGPVPGGDLRRWCQPLRAFHLCSKKCATFKTSEINWNGAGSESGALLMALELTNHICTTSQQTASTTRREE